MKGHQPCIDPAQPILQKELGAKSFSVLSFDNHDATTRYRPSLHVPKP